METKVYTDAITNNGEVDLAFEIDLELEHEKKLNLLEQVHQALSSLRGY
jgi:hypothetical protein